jgi:hypothetical protein
VSNVKRAAELEAIRRTHWRPILSHWGAIRARRLYLPVYRLLCRTKNPRHRKKQPAFANEFLIRLSIMILIPQRRRLPTLARVLVSN